MEIKAIVRVLVILVQLVKHIWYCTWLNCDLITNCCFVRVKLGHRCLCGVIWLNITKFGVYLRYRHCFNLFKEMRKESEFRQRCCWNSTKVWERKRKSGREKILNFGNVITKIPTAQTSCLSVCCVLEVGSAQKRNQLWQCHCRNREIKFCGNCGNAIVKNGRGKENSGCWNLGMN